MKVLKKHTLKINPKYLSEYGNADWRLNSKYFKRYYCFTDASVTQLRKLDVPSFKALYGFENTYKKYYKALIGNIIRKKNEDKVNQHLQQLLNKKQLKAA